MSRWFSVAYLNKIISHLHLIKWIFTLHNYVTYQHSILPEFKAVWSKIVEFNKTDPSVLSADPDKHIAKALDGNYAYLGDKTQITLEMATECTLQTGEEEILPFQYAFGLPNNSPFTSLFSNE